MIDSMNCKDCEELLSEYLDRSLHSEAAASVAAHLSRCVACHSLFAELTDLVAAGRRFPVYSPPEWLATRIVANTPQANRRSLLEVLAATWRSLGEPRTALAIFTAAMVLGWFGAGVTREAIFNKAETMVSCTYDRAIRSYYRSPLIIEIHSKFGQLLENS